MLSETIDAIDMEMRAIGKRWGVKPARFTSLQKVLKYGQAVAPFGFKAKLSYLVQRFASLLMPVKNRSARTHHCRVGKSTKKSTSSNSSDDGSSDPDRSQEFFYPDYKLPIFFTLISSLAIFFCLSVIEVVK